MTFFTLASGELGACLRLNGRVDFAFRPLEASLGLQKALALMALIICNPG